MSYDTQFVIRKVRDWIVRGVQISPGSDKDVDLVRVAVTGDPKLWWDESEDKFAASKEFTPASIPDLNASKITAGTLGDARIPNLNASKITAGTFVDARIPNLNASKVTSGTLNQMRVPFESPGQIGSTTPGTGKFSAIEVTGTVGVDINPGSDADTDLITVGVSGTPKFSWDEGANSFRSTHTIHVIKTGANVGFFAHVSQTPFQGKCDFDDDSTSTIYLDLRRANNSQTGKLFTNGSGVFALADVSDARFKSNIKLVEEDCLALVCAIPISEYDKNGTHQVGFVAQEVQKVFPEMVTEMQAFDEPWPNEAGPALGISRTTIIPHLVRAIQQLTDRVKVLESQTND